MGNVGRGHFLDGEHRPWLPTRPLGCCNDGHPTPAGRGIVGTVGRLSIAEIGHLGHIFYAVEKMQQLPDFIFRIKIYDKLFKHLVKFNFIVPVLREPLAILMC